MITKREIVWDPKKVSTIVMVSIIEGYPLPEVPL